LIDISPEGEGDIAVTQVMLRAAAPQTYRGQARCGVQVIRHWEEGS